MTTFYSGRDYGRFYLGEISSEYYRYCHIFSFASLTPTGDLIPRHQYVDGWGNTGVTWAGVENMLRNMKNWGAYPVFAIWLANLDMSDAEWNTQRRSSPMSIPNPQPKITYAGLEAFLSRLNAILVSLDFENMIFIPCWEFNQTATDTLQNRREWCWGEDIAGSYRDWDLDPAAYNTFMEILVRARNAVAPRVRIGVAPDGMAGKVNDASVDRRVWGGGVNPDMDWEWSWTRQWGGRDGFFHWLDGFRKCNFDFDAFGVSQYPRFSSSDPLASDAALIDQFLGEQWNRRIVELVGLQGKSFMLYEYNLLGTPRANATFIENTYKSVMAKLDAGLVNYESIGWYLGFRDAEAWTRCNELALLYSGYTPPTPPIDLGTLALIALMAIVILS